MYLKRLEVYGFKSFGARSVLEFDENSKKPNITAIVGPNGSGKSNIADAIRWILGEQSSSVLRGKKGEDIIFGGSESKPKSSYAEASLFLAGKESIKLEIGNTNFSLSEIEVTRKLYRSGESEYLINRKKVRLIDIQQLLASLGFGQSTYTVIGQGMVDRLLFFNAEERRVLFDEAAGVKQYKIKRDQATKKLLGTEENIVRLQDIQSELEPRVVNLRRLVKRAEGRLEIEAELKTVENRYYSAVSSELKLKTETLEKEEALIKREISNIEQNIYSLKNISKEDSPGTDYVEQESDLRERIDQDLAHRDGLIREIAYAEGQLRQHQASAGAKEKEREELIKERAELADKIVFLENKIIDNKKDIENANLRQKSLKADLGIIEVNFDKLEREHQASDKNVELDQLRKLEQEERALENKKTHLVELINATEQRKLQEKILFENNQKEKARLNETLLDCEEKSRVLMKQRDRLQQSGEKLKAELSEEERNNNRLSRNIAKLNLEIKNLSDQINPDQLGKLENRVEALDIEQKRIAELLYKTESLTQLSSLKEIYGKYSIGVKNIFLQIKKLTKAVNPEAREKLEEDINALRIELGNGEKERTETLMMFERFKADTEQTENRIMELNKDILKTKTNLEKINITANDNNSSLALEENEKQLEAVTEKIKQIVNKKKPYEGKVSDFENKYLLSKDEFNRKIATIRSNLYEISLNLTKKQNILDNQIKENENSGIRLKSIDTMLSQVGENNEENHSPIVKGIEERKIKLNEIEVSIAQLKNRLADLSIRRKKLEEGRFEGERKIHGLENQIFALNQKINDLNLEKAKVETRSEDFNEEIKRMDISVDHGEQEIINQETKDLLRAKIENLRRRKESVGGIDPETISEYEEMEKRSVEMRQQLEDLAKAKGDLESIIDELDNRIKSQFSKTFSKIAAEFNRYFTILFNGGKAELNLDKDDEGNLGVEITANPPGKRLKSLSVLSGGEKTLTSLALLFSILAVNPSPFCVLDEVDAALDESNTLRFIKILGELATKTQFVIISHNRETMKAADLLYGITMNENHISKLLSVRLKEAEELTS